MSISEYYHWWVSEIADLFPTIAMGGLGQSADFILSAGKKTYSFTWKNQQYNIDHNEKFSSESAAAYYQSSSSQENKLKANTCDIHFQSEALLKREITLPLATEENIENVVAYEIDRYMPFKREDIYFDIQIKHRDKNNNRITAVITAIKKNFVDEIITFCQSTQLTLEKFYAIDKHSNELAQLSFVGLTGMSRGGAKSNNRILAGLTILLIFVALFLPIIKNYWLAYEQRNQIQQMSDEIHEVNELRSSFKHARKQAQRAKNLSANSVKLIELLKELTDIVPDDTSLLRFSFENNTSRIRGTSESATKLIGLIDASNMFSEVQFVAPVTTNSETGKENFTIQFVLNNDDSDS